MIAPRGFIGLDQLKRQSVRGGAITAVFQALNVALNLISTATLARLLSPEEFGVVGMALVVTSFARLFKDLGLSSSTIQRATLTHAQLSTLHWVNVAVGAVLTGLVALLAPLVSHFLGRPELTMITVFVSFTFLIGGFSTQQSALLIREMRFGRREFASLAGSLSTFLIAAVFALNGFSYWSLVYGTLGGSVVGVVLIKVFSDWRPGWPTRGSGVRSMLRYGLNLTGFEIVNYFSRNLDNILIGRAAGADALGLYSKAYGLMMLPLTNLRGPINAVAFPALSRLQDRPKDFRAYYCTVVAMLAMASMPIVSLLFVVAEPLILVVLGPQWVEAAGLFSILAFAAFFQTSSGFRGTALVSLGMASRQLKQGVISAIVACTGFLIGIRWGMTGVAVSYAITSLIMTFPMHVYCFRGTPLRVGDYYRSISVPMFASLTAGAAAYGLRRVAMVDMQAHLDLVLTFSAFSMCYLGLLSLHAGSRRKLGQFAGLIRQIWPLKR